MSEDTNTELARRALLKAAGGMGAYGLLSSVAAADPGPEEFRQARSETEPHTADTIAALVDAVIPRTPDLKDEPGEDGEPLGEEHTPGGLNVDLDEFLVTYMNTLFQNGTQVTGYVEDLRLAEVLAGALDEAAAELLARNMNRDQPGDHAPDGEDWSTGGPFTRLTREDRIRAIALFDEDEKDDNTVEAPGPVVEGDAGILATLAVAFPEVVYYSEWQGYPDGADLTDPPSERTHPNDPEAVQSWRQTGFPGNANGYRALRGYASAPGSPLGGGPGDVWKTIKTKKNGELSSADSNSKGGTLTQPLADDPYPDDPDESSELQITVAPGSFEDNEDYDTSGYTDIFPESDDSDASFDGDSGARHGPVDVDAGGDARVDSDSTLSDLRELFAGGGD